YDAMNAECRIAERARRTDLSMPTVQNLIECGTRAITRALSCRDDRRKSSLWAFRNFRHAYLPDSRGNERHPARIAEPRDYRRADARAEIRSADETERSRIVLEGRVCGPDEEIWRRDLIDRLQLLIRENYESVVRGRKGGVIGHQARKRIGAHRSRVSERNDKRALARLSWKVHHDLLAVALRIEDQLAERVEDHRIRILQVERDGRASQNIGRWRCARQ